MSSRLTRTLLKLYPRRIRDRYGDELLDLQDELRAQGEASRTRLIRDMLAGSLMVRSARRGYLMIAAVLLIGALAAGGATIGELGGDSGARASRVPTANASPYGSCFVNGGSSCSLTPCSEFTAQPPADTAVAHSSLVATLRRARVTVTRCAAYPRVRRQRPVFVGE